jgi:GH43 family beta-xylosidase
MVAGIGLLCGLNLFYTCACQLDNVQPLVIPTVNPTGGTVSPVKITTTPENPVVTAMPTQTAGIPSATATAGPVQIRQYFSNPVDAAGQDPWVIYKDGYYYYCQSLQGDTRIGVAKARRLQDIGTEPMVVVYTPPAGTMYTRELWAPELHYLDGKWYIYFAADNGDNYNHRMYVLESKTQDPLSEYTFKGKIAAATDKWAIDGTVLVTDNGNKYFIWSGWEGNTNVRQNLYIARMSNPYTIAGERVEISRPAFSWETNASPHVNEGPEVLKKDGVIHLIYSAGGSWTDDYCLGRLTCTTGDVMNPAAWQKAGPVFTKTATSYGPGHASFVPSPDGTENWIVYHANQFSGSSWGGRSIRTQPFTWDGSTPVFGAPVKYGALLPEPSGTTAAGLE